MPAPEKSRPGAAQWALARFALRDLRGSLRFYGVFIAALVLGVMAIVGVNATARAFRDGLAQQGAVLLGGDLAFRRAFGAPSEPQRAFLEQRGKFSQIVTLRAMARRADAPGSALVELKAVDSAYPLTGAVGTEPPLPPGQCFFARLAAQDGAFGLFADRTLGARLNMKIGDSLEIGAARFILAGWLASEPDSVGLHRLRPAPDGQRRRAEGDRADHARLGGAPVPAPAPSPGKSRRCGCCRGSKGIYRRLSRFRLRDSQPRRALAPACAQCRAIRAIPVADRPDRSGLRRRRRRQFDSRPDRPQAQDPRHFEGAGRERRRGGAIRSVSRRCWSPPPAH